MTNINENVKRISLRSMSIHLAMKPTFIFPDLVNKQKCRC